MHANALIGISFIKKREALALTLVFLIPFSFFAQNLRPVAAFVPNAFTTYLSSGGKIHFKNNSVNSESYLWDFGDGAGTSSEEHPVYYYNSPGIYNVKLVTRSKHNVDSMDILIIVMADEKNYFLKQEDQIGFSYNTLTAAYNLKLDFTLMKDVSVSICDTNLKTIRQETLHAISAAEIPIDVANLTAGTYIVMVRTQDGVKKTFKIIK
jgi:PKD repeat protein